MRRSGKARLSRRLVELEVAVPQRLDGKQPSSLRPDGLRAGLHLWAAGYVPVGWVVKTGASHPRWPQIVSAGPNGVNPAARPIPPCGEVDEHVRRWRAGRVCGIGVPD